MVLLSVDPFGLGEFCYGKFRDAVQVTYCGVVTSVPLL